MKLKESYFRNTALGIAVILIFYETIKNQFGLSVDPKIEKIATIILFIIAAGLYIYGRTLRKKSSPEGSENKK